MQTAVNKKLCKLLNKLAAEALTNPAPPKKCPSRCIRLFIYDKPCSKCAGDSAGFCGDCGKQLWCDDCNYED